MPRLPLSPGPPVGLVKLFYCLCYLAYFNEDVLFWKEQLKSHRLQPETSFYLYQSTVSVVCWYLSYITITFDHPIFRKRNTWQSLPEGHLTTHNAVLQVFPESVQTLLTIWIKKKKKFPLLQRLCVEPHFPNLNKDSRQKGYISFVYFDPKQKERLPVTWLYNALIFAFINRDICHFHLPGLRHATTN